MIVARERRLAVEGSAQVARYHQPSLTPALGTLRRVCGHLDLPAETRTYPKTGVEVE